MPPEDQDVQTRVRSRFFFISYTGDSPVMRGGIVGHLSFSHPAGFPSMSYICEVLVPKKARHKPTNVVITSLFEFQTEEDFEDFIAGHDLDQQLNDIFRA